MGSERAVASVKGLPDCESCEAPCCRRQMMDNDDGWFTLADARALYRPIGADVRVVGWVQREDGRQPLLECQAFDVSHHACSVYELRPDHCRVYDCRADDPEEDIARPHCDLARHRRSAALRSRA